MTTRTLNFLGRVISGPGSVLVHCRVNGQMLYNQVLPAGSHPDPGQDTILWSVQIPLSWQGPIPIEIHCGAGSFQQTQVTANYCGNLIDLTLTDSWREAHPAVNQLELLNDIMQHGNDWTWIENKYGSAAPGYSDIVTTVVTASANNFQDAAGENTVESDGRDNVTIDGVAVTMDTSMRGGPLQLLGDWAWEVQADQTLAYTLNLRPAMDID